MHKNTNVILFNGALYCADMKAKIITHPHRKGTSIQGTYHLRITSATVHDEGTYRCVATNESGSATTKSFTRIDGQSSRYSWPIISHSVIFSIVLLQMAFLVHKFRRRASPRGSLFVSAMPGPSRVNHYSCNARSRARHCPTSLGTRMALRWIFASFF